MLANVIRTKQRKRALAWKKGTRKGLLPKNENRIWLAKAWQVAQGLNREIRRPGYLKDILLAGGQTGKLQN